MEEPQSDEQSNNYHNLSNLDSFRINDSNEEVNQSNDIKEQSDLQHNCKNQSIFKFKFCFSFSDFLMFLTFVRIFNIKF